MHPDFMPSEMGLDLELHCLLAQDDEYHKLHRKLMQRIQMLQRVPRLSFNISPPNLKVGGPGRKGKREDGCLKLVTFAYSTAKGVCPKPAGGSWLSEGRL